MTRKDRADRAVLSMSFVGLIAVVGLLLPGRCDAAGDTCQAGTVNERVSVKWVIDGDTVVLGDGRHLRFIGFNAPERAHDNAPAEPFGEAAWRALKADLPAGSILLLEYDRERHDRHRRLLAHAFLADGTNLQARMLRDGLGVRLTIPPDLRHQACYRAAERQARRDRRGLWSDWPRLPLAAPGNDVIDGRFRLSRGIVRSVRNGHGGWTLSLDNGLLLRIGHHGRASGFRQAALLRLKGRTVLARGYVYHYHGRLWMSITHPNNLQTVE